MELSAPDISTLRDAITCALHAHRRSCPRCAEAVDYWTNPGQLCDHGRRYVLMDRRLRDMGAGIVQRSSNHG